MNLRSISHHLVGLPEKTPAERALRESLRWSFLEREQTAREEWAPKSLAADGLQVVESLVLSAESVGFLGPSTAKTAFHVLDWKRLEAGVFEVAGPFRPLRSFHLIDCLLVFESHRLVVFKGSQLLLDHSFPEGLEWVLDGKAGETALRFAVLTSDGRVELLTVRLDERTVTSQRLSAPPNVRLARVSGEGAVVLSYENELTGFGPLGLAKLPIACEVINDFELSADGTQLHLLVDSAAVVTVDSDLRVVGRKQLGGVFSRLRLSEDTIALHSDFPGSQTLLLAAGTLRELLATDERVVGLSKEGKVVTWVPASNSLRMLVLGPKTICNTKPAFKAFKGTQLLSSIRDTEVSDFAVHKPQDDSQTFKVFVHFKSKQTALLTSDFSGNCAISSVIDFEKLIGDESKSLGFLGELRFRERDLLVLTEVNPQEQYLTLLFDPLTSKLEPLLVSDTPTRQVLAMPIFGFLLVRQPTRLLVLISREEGFAQLKEISFEGELAAVDVNADTLLAVGRNSSAHFYRFAYKSDVLTVSYVGGDVKGRKVRSGVLVGPNCAHLVLESGKSVFLSANKERVYERLKDGKLRKLKSPSALSEEILFPYGKVESEGAGLKFLPLSPDQLEFLREEGRLPKLAKDEGSGLLFDIQGNVDLVCKIDHKQKAEIAALLESQCLPGGPLAIAVGPNSQYS